MKRMMLIAMVTVFLGSTADAGFRSRRVRVVPVVQAFLEPVKTCTGGVCFR